MTGTENRLVGKEEAHKLAELARGCQMGKDTYKGSIPAVVIIAGDVERCDEC